MEGLPSEQIKEDDCFESHRIDADGMVATADKLSGFLRIQVSDAHICGTRSLLDLAESCSDVIKRSRSVGIDVEGTQFPATPMASEQLGPLHQLQQPTKNSIEFEDAVTRRKSMRNLANDKENSRRRQTVLMALKVMGLVYIGAVLIMPGIYIYREISRIVTPGNNSLLKMFPISITLIPLSWILYIVTTGLVLSTFGARDLLLPFDYKYQASVILFWSMNCMSCWSFYRLQSFTSSSSLVYRLRQRMVLSCWCNWHGVMVDRGVYSDALDITNPALLSVRGSAMVEEEETATIECHEVTSENVRFESVGIGQQSRAHAPEQTDKTAEFKSNLGASESIEATEQISSEKIPPLSKLNTGLIAGAGEVSTVDVGHLVRIYLVGLVSTVSGVAAYVSFQWLASHAEFITDGTIKQAVAERTRYGYLIFPLMMTFPRYVTISTPLMMFPEPTLHMELLMQVARRQKLSAIVSSSAAASVVYGVTLAALTCVLDWSVIRRLEEFSTESSDSEHKLETEHMEDMREKDIYFLPNPSKWQVNGNSVTSSALQDQERRIWPDLLGYLSSWTGWRQCGNDHSKHPASNSRAHRTGTKAHSFFIGCTRAKSRTLDVASRLKLSSKTSAKQPSAYTRKNDLFKFTSAWNEQRRTSNVHQIIDLSFLRCVPSILQVATSLALLMVALYPPPILAPGAVSLKMGTQWVYGFVPVTYFSTGVTFAVLGVTCTWVLSRNIVDGQGRELWSPLTLCHAVWETFKQTLANTFVELGRCCSGLCTTYLRSLNTSVNDRERANRHSARHGHRSTQRRRE